MESKYGMKWNKNGIECPTDCMIHTNSVPCMVVDAFRRTKPTDLYPVSTDGRCPIPDLGHSLCETYKQYITYLSPD